MGGQERAERARVLERVRARVRVRVRIHDLGLGALILIATSTSSSLVSCKTQPAAGDAKSSLSNATETWCPEGFESGPSDTCFAVPDHAPKDTPVLIYLHGMYEGHGSPAEWEAVRVAAQRGFAVIIPRGKRGQCAWRVELKNHFCWPQEPEDTDAMKMIIADWDKVLWQVDALLEGGGTHKRYVLGYSNGGFFASFIATHGLFPGQAYAVVNGGPLEPPSSKTKPVPMLLISDVADSGPKMKELHEVLGKASWPHAYCPRAGGSAITTDDVEGALRFFKHDADGSLKPQAGAYPCEPASARK